ncbi:MAG: CotH kinase family protein [Lachnospiraceae bacterium]
MKKVQKLLRRSLATGLAFAMTVSGMAIVPGSQQVHAADASDQIEISNAEELAKIGKDKAYPMDGDYVLTNDIDLASIDWTPIGGSGGSQYALVSGERVFNGTFDGAGHVISGLTIQCDGSNNSGYRYSQSGLFAMLGSEDASDYAEVKNIVFTDVSISHNLGGGDTIGTLAADADGFVKIDNVAVLGGSIEVTANNGGDLIGVGGIIGQSRNNTAGVHMSNLYNAASVNVSSAVSTPPVRCGGIIGRIYQGGEIGSLSSCLNIGTVTYKGSKGYAINGYSQNAAVSSNTANVTNCYYLEGSGIAYTEGGSVSESDLKSEALAEKLGADYWYVSRSGQVMPKVTDGKVAVPIPSPTFADGDKASSVTEDFTLPLTYTGEDGEETISWSSSNPDVITISGSKAEVKGVLADTEVTLTATTSKTGKTKTVKVTVKSNLELEFDREYAKPGQLMKASVKDAPADTEFTYVWQRDKSTLSESDCYTPVSADLNTFITVRASLKSTGATVAEKKIYCSKLPVVYIDTEDGYGITSKETYKSATMKIQGNDSFNSTNTTLYDGGISIRGRGNSTWNMGYSKLPYKIKLDSKTNLLGFGNSKHWALLANYMDESLLRNKTSYDLSGKMGMVYLKSTNVEVILNGVYAGNYQLVGNVRIDKSRVNIHNWEDVASDAAKAIAKKEGIKGDAKDALEDYMTEHLEWITSGSLSYNGKTYQIEDYYTDLPKDSSGKTDVSGGYLFELDEYYDEVSKFRTKKNQPIMFKNPEFAYTNTELFTAAQNYVQAVEDSINSEDYYTTYQGEKKHYTDLVDMDSLVRYLMLNEFYWNTETMKKSTYMYKDLGGKLYVGPVWDMDWTSNSQVSAGETSNYRAWMVVTRSANAQGNSWYKALIGDPYFVTKLYECYKENRQNFEDIVKTGGILDQQKEYLLESGNANYQAGYLMHHSTFESEVERLRTFLKNRLEWLDQQFASVDTLLASLGKYKASSAISVTETTSAAGKAVLTAEIKNNNSIKKVGFYVNGVLCATVTVENGKAVFEASDDLLTKTEGGLNTVQVRGMDASGNLLSGGSLSNYVDFAKTIAAEKLTGTVTISGEAKVGAVLRADVQDSNNSGVLSYQWMADDVAIEGATEETYALTEAEIGKVITVAVTSSIETGSLVSAATDAVIKEELKNDHLIINQVYGGGANDGTPVSHSFIELYNPTDNAISLEGYSIGYLSNGKSNTPQEVKLALSGSMPSHASYLIRCEAQDDSTPDLIRFTVSKFDQEWTQTIDNKRYQITLYKGTKVEDAVSVNEGNVEGSALPDGTISKQKAIRRIGFADTNNNTADFEVVSYKDDATAATEKYPRSLADGAWGNGETPTPDPKPDPDPKPAELSGSVSIRGNAIVGATLYADDAGVANNTGTLSYQWLADGSEITGANSAFLTVGKGLTGKQISVKVTSSVETGTLTSEMTAAVVEKEAQTTHLIIHQVYGGGGKGKTPVSASFIELYNPTAENIELTGYSIAYVSGSTQEQLELNGTIAAHTSYLIKGQEEKASSDLVYTIEKADQEWNLAISNKQYRIVLKKGEEQIDGVSVNEEAAEGNALVNPEGDEIISKKKAIRRISFIDTDDNAADFEVLNYSKIPSVILEQVRPRSTADGSWGMEDIVIPEKYYTVTFDVDGQKESISVKEGERVSEKEAPQKEGYTFLGWYMEDQKYDFEMPVTADITLCAKWEKKETPDPDPTPDPKPDPDPEPDPDPLPDLPPRPQPDTEQPDTEPTPEPTPTPAETIQAPQIVSVQSIAKKKTAAVQITVEAVSGATGYQIYRKKGSKVTMIGQTAGTVFLDQNPVSGTSSYYAKAIKGSITSKEGSAKAITLPKATAKATAKAKKDKTVVLSWKKVKGATGYLVYRSTKKNGSYQRIAVLKKGTKCTYTDKKGLKKGKKYYYRIVTVKKKTYSPAKTTKAVKIKEAKNRQ